MVARDRICRSLDGTHVRATARWLTGSRPERSPSRRLGFVPRIQESRVELIAGIVVAWLLGGILEELVFRGIVLNSVESLLTSSMTPPIATAVAVCVAALGAGVVHFYQGPRAMVIITQLSILFGVLFVVSGHSLRTVMLCHGMYDTIAFIRFANKKSKYSDLDSDPLSSGKQPLEAGLTR